MTHELQAVLEGLQRDPQTPNPLLCYGFTCKRCPCRKRRVLDLFANSAQSVREQQIGNMDPASSRLLKGLLAHLLF